MGAATRSKRIALVAAAGALAVGILAASAASEGLAGSAGLVVANAGLGMVTITPAGDGGTAFCKIVDRLETDGSQCDQTYEPGTRVTLTAKADPGRSLVGWSDFICPGTPTRCTFVVAAGTRYVSARFSPVTLQISGTDFGTITVTPKPSTSCGFESENTCLYPWGTKLTLRRQHGAAGKHWVGPCDGAKDVEQPGNQLDADVCRVTLVSDELVGAGYEDPGRIPPPQGAGLTVKLGGSGKGTVVGHVVGDPSRTLRCGTRCKLTGLYDTDQVDVTAQPRAGSCFYIWDSRTHVRNLRIDLGATTAVRASFIAKPRVGRCKY